MQIFSIKYDKPNSTTYSKDHSHDEVDFIPRREDGSNHANQQR